MTEINNSNSNYRLIFHLIPVSFFSFIFILPANAKSVSPQNVTTKINNYSNSRTNTDNLLTVDFFRSPESIFKSGQSHFSDLLKTEKKRFYKYQALIQRGTQKILIPGDYILTDLQTSSVFLHTPTQQTYQFIQQQSSWVFAKNLETNESKWLLLSDLAPISSDLGLGINLSPAFIKNNPFWLSSTKHVFAAESRFMVLGFNGGWVKVRSLSAPLLEGYIDGNNLITRFDFASMVSSKSPSKLQGVIANTLTKMDAENWMSVKYREEDKLILDNDKSISINDVKSIITRPDLAIAIRSLAEPNLLLKQHLKIISIENALWLQSEIKGHGLISWKWPKPKEKPLNINEFSTEQILKREIFSMSIHPKNANLGIVSANGIFMTTNGKTWKRLENFNYENHPVLITEKNQIYVGDKLSHDYANSFHPYFRWEEISKIVSELNKKADEIRLSNLEFSNKNNILKIQLETNGNSNKHITIASKLDTHLRPVHWGIY